MAGLALVITVAGLAGGAPAQPSFEVLHAFVADGFQPMSALVAGRGPDGNPDGFLYGTTRQGGLNGFGNVFKIDATTGALAVIYSFKNQADGAFPSSALFQARDGYFYGTTEANGADPRFGPMFRVDRAGGGFQVVASDVTSGTPSSSVLQDRTNDSYFYVLYRWNNGDVLRIDTSTGQIVSLHAFNGTDGTVPNNDLIQTSDGSLYGTTRTGGVNGTGTVFTLGAGGGITVLHSFGAGEGTPLAGLVMGRDGFFYGTTQALVFRIDGSGNFAVLHTFNVATEGGNPLGALIQGADDAFYGTNSAGPFGSPEGTIFRMTAGGAFTVLHRFVFTNVFANAEGSAPQASLVQTGDGFLWGTASDAGARRGGSIFRISTAGDQYQTVHFFGTEAQQPRGSALVQGTDGKFYGTTFGGGALRNGTVFSMDGSGAVTVLLSLGNRPSGSLIQSDDGTFYGTLRPFSGNIWGGGDCGAGSQCAVFGMDATGALTLLTGAGGLTGGLGGTSNYLSLTQRSDGAIYGTSDECCVFTMDGAGAITLLVFPERLGNALAPMIQASDDALYGTTTDGGPRGGGSIFRVDASGNFSRPYSFGFSGVEPSHPRAPLVEASPGQFYGTTQAGGDGALGTIFRFDRAAGTVTTVYSFSGADGTTPQAGLLRASDGNFYGTTTAGGAHGYGTVYKMDAGGAVTVVHSFDYFTDGGVPLSQLIQASDTALYGTTSQGGPADGGTIFRLTTGPPADTTPPVLALPGNMTVEASSASGAVVFFNATASDAVDGLRPVTCVPSSGSTFPLGVTTVNCSASDSHGNTANGSFTATVQDTTGPTLSLPANITGEATSAAGAAVTYAASAADLVDGAVLVTCTPASGSTFPITTTTVACSATDSRGNTASGSFAVTVMAPDTTAPVLGLPGDLTVGATSAAGAIVTYAATATDAVDGTVPVSCIPASGSTFPIGTTTVNCSATDAHSNTAVGSFDVTVELQFAVSLPNPGFESGFSGWSSGGGFFDTYSNDLLGSVLPPEGAFNGSYSAYTSSGTLFMVIPHFRIEPNATYTLQVLVGGRLDSFSFAGSRIELFDADTGAVLASYEVHRGTGDSPVNGWQTHTASFSTASGGDPIGHRLGVRLIGLGEGPQTWFDNVTVTTNVLVDQTAPVLSLADVTVDATAPQGATVNYVALATDAVDGPVPPSCFPAAGSTFPIGTTTVNCSATDAHSNTAVGSFDVTVNAGPVPQFSIALLNPGFESGFSGWSSGGGFFDTYSNDLLGSVLPPEGAFNGSYSAYTSSGTLFMVIPHFRIEPNATYTLQVLVGGRLDSFSFAGSRIELFDADTGAVLASYEVHRGTGDSPVNGWQTHTASFSTASGGGPIGHRLGVRLSGLGEGPQTWFDNVTVTTNVLVDQTAPVLSLPDIIVLVPGPSGATVTYAPVALDAVDGPLPVSCAPASGTAFPVGSATVSCSTIDAHGNTALGTFTVTVNASETAPSSLTVLNPGFETGLSDWIASGFVATFSNSLSGQLLPEGDFNGTDSAYTSGVASASQVIAGYVIDASTTYALHVLVGGRLESSGFGFAGSRIELFDVDTSAILTSYEVHRGTGASPVDGVWQTHVASFSTGASGESIAHRLGIRLIGLGEGSQTWFDNVAIQNSPVVSPPEDTTPPDLTLPGNITLQASASSPVSYIASASDVVDGPVPVSCSPASGATFPLGTTIVNCRASDSRGNTATGGFTVTLQTAPVADTTPPVLSLPGNLTVEATSAAGAVVTFSATATDAVDGVRPVSCAPASGATFPLGTTTVSCSASDSHGNTTNGSFTVTVRDTTLPTISFGAPTPTANANGWNSTDVSIPFSAADATGIATLNPASPLVLSSEGAAVTGTVTATDNVGNSTTAPSPAVKIDKTAPTVSVAAPAASATYTLGQVVASSYVCTDTLSGVASCAGPVPTGSNIDTGSVGPKTFTVNATDRAGNAVSQTTNYSVIAPNGADLIVTAVSNPPAVALPGGTFSVTDTTKNQGTLAAGGSRTRYYLSTDGLKDAADGLLTSSRAVPNLASGATSFGTVTVTIPAATALGTYVLLACADDLGAVVESNETNNCLASATTVQVTRPDLIVTAVSNPPAAALPGSTFSVTDTTTNQGLLIAGASTTRYYLSADILKDAADQLLTGTRAVPGLTAGATSSGTGTVTIPAAAALGTYFLLACADDTTTVAESNESNNCLVSTTTIQVTRPDLIVTAVSNPPAAALPGGTFSVTDTVTNQGLLDAAASTTRYYLSADQVKDTGDQRLTGTRAVPSLVAGTSSTAAITVTIPAGTALGTYYLLACADDTTSVTERDETNNCRVAASTIQVTRPDLVATSVSDPPTVALPGSTFLVTDTVTNQGLLDAAASTTRYYLSADQVKDAADQRLTGTRAVPSLVAGASSTAAITVTIPNGTGLGTYYLLACADDTTSVTERDETNNCLAATATIQVTRPDLVATAVDNPLATARRGTTFAVTDTITNQGPIAAGASTTRYYLSTDQVKDAGDRRLTGTRPVLGLGAGASSTGTTTVTIPNATTLGTYYLLACADDTTSVTESDETNNCIASTTQITVAP